MSTVSDILDGISNGLPNKVNIARVNRSISLISKRLFYHKSSLAKGALAVSVSVDTSSASLPADYWGMVDRPYIVGLTTPLKQLPDLETKLAYTSKSQPIYFDVLGQTIYLYPGTSSAITIGGDYWAKPTKLTAVTDTVPYNELFDEAIREALLDTPPDENGRGKGEGSVMEAIINKAVDEIAPYRDKKTPTQVVDNMCLDYMAEREWF